MIVLGINAFHGDASACLIEDGKIIAAVAEERFTRNKHEGGLPVLAIKWCISQTNKKITDVAISRNPRLFLPKKIGAVIRSPMLFKRAIGRLGNSKKIISLKPDLENILDNNIILHNIEHHLAHLAYAYVTSNFKDSALLSVDGFGDFVSTAWGSGSKNFLKIKKRVYFPHSLGVFYTALTQFLGFDGYGEEYKVMALASFGIPRYKNIFSKIIWQTNDGFKIDSKYFLHVRRGVDMTFGKGTPHIEKIFSDEIVKILGPAKKREDPLTERHFDIAASMQAVTNDIIFHLAVLAKESCHYDQLAISGGVGLNGVANGIIERKEIFKKIWFPSAPGDDGTAIGAAAVVALRSGDVFYDKNNDNPFLGPEYPEKSFKGGIILPKDQLLDEVVRLLSKKKIIGWYEGRAEFGPRALGHRSIIADPRGVEMRQRINSLIKKREDFRPFAPMVLLDDLNKYFVTDKASPNMMVITKVREEWKGVLTAITHVDDTARVQTVVKENLPNVAELLIRWKKVSGFSVLLNTSFNENEPIVNTPDEAISCFKRTDIDALVINETLFMK